MREGWDVDTQETVAVAAGGTGREQSVDGGAGGGDAFQSHECGAGTRHLRMDEPLDLPVAAAHQISGAHILGIHNGVSISHHHR